MAVLGIRFYVCSICAYVCFLCSSCSPIQTTGLRTSCSKPDVEVPSNWSEYVDDGPLLLTPYIERGCLEEARRLSRVMGVPGMSWDSFSGFLTVRPQDEANLFFWFFPAKVKPGMAPVILWLNGGPGTSALSGVFAENGPFYVTKNYTLNYREDNWATEFNMLYLDNPVGAGFSFAKSVEAYCNSSLAVAQDIYVALTMFFTMFDLYSSNEFYVTGQSYGGKFAVLLADVIDSKNSAADPNRRFNFTGVICLACFLDPTSQLAFADYWYQVGLMDPKDYPEALRREAEITENLRSGNSTEAMAILNSYFGNHESFMFLSAAFVDGENVLQSMLPSVFRDYPSFVNCSDVRRAIHVGNLTFTAASIDVSAALYDDFLVGVMSTLASILDKDYKVLLMSGNLDVLVTSTVYRRLAWQLQWKHAEAFGRSKRLVWKVDPDDEEFAGYVNCVENLCYSMVRNGGHRLSSDQTRSTSDLIRRFMYDLLPASSNSSLHPLT